VVTKAFSQASQAALVNLVSAAMASTSSALFICDILSLVRLHSIDFIEYTSNAFHPRFGVVEQSWGSIEKTLPGARGAQQVVFESRFVSSLAFMNAAFVTGRQR
jgi:hypothetical protein